MIIHYFDSSLVLAILFEENTQDTAYNIWQSNNVRVSSVLLKIETNNALMRYHKLRKNCLDSGWLDKKRLQLNAFLRDVFYSEITEKFADSMAENYTLANCKSLDAIHIATALNIKSNPNNSDIRLCSFDKKMLATAGQFGIETQGG
ncbi:DNA-binding protein [Fibrobacterales bacterium]|nr:DNA-binding protein [Fibrobacterales bacterium]